MQAVRDWHPEKEVEVYFQDESRFGLKTSQRRCYAKRGSRPRKVVQQKYEWLYLWGAVNPANGKKVGLVSPTVNTDWMNVHLKLISESNQNKHVALVLDQAGWHTSKALQIPENITLLPLPPYSPELNPIELVWLYERTHFLESRLYENYEELEESVCEAWNLLDVNTLKSITGFDWILSTYL